MSTNKHGGPAFPVPGMNLPNDLTVFPLIGMTLRDYFAAKAMQARLAGVIMAQQAYAWGADEAARDAYGIADAMLRAREGGAA